ncbi:cbb3-type cytochrome oxidase assembly protein CcoS [Saccharobesus litoralis]|uniref:Cbb3-type cytochrome oxidase assembly protein CcoS n=1 Tax=Saccharobesus litoralis TaxID=2172099 RepID=A0A2S0VT24_9ALTE|nr:cbb3-type cytochrome oxidase assembly protein CcoS [Saccharobesus litoralis]AWB67332.1 cbb3-type cytochrome oxidase assembly protein CcoS [Saccharobesus litoralis]
MNVVYVLIPLAIVIVLIAIGVFFWAVKSEQFDDLDRQAYNILFDDENKPNKPATANDVVDGSVKEQTPTDHQKSSKQESDLS